MGEGLGKISTASSPGLTHSFWLISCWRHPRIYIIGNGLGKISTALGYIFLFSAASRKVYNALLKLARRVIFLLPSDVYVRSFFFFYHYHFNKISTKLWVTETVFGPRVKSSPLETTNLAEHCKLSPIMLEAHLGPQDKMWAIILGANLNLSIPSCYGT